MVVPVAQTLRCCMILFDKISMLLEVTQTLKWTLIRRTGPDFGLRK